LLQTNITLLLTAYTTVRAETGTPTRQATAPYSGSYLTQLEDLQLETFDLRCKSNIVCGVFRHYSTRYHAGNTCRYTGGPLASTQLTTLTVSVLQDTAAAGLGFFDAPLARRCNGARTPGAHKTTSSPSLHDAGLQRSLTPRALAQHALDLHCRQHAQRVSAECQELEGTHMLALES
jgi:hypothetical protein